mgnify:FL=1
MYYEELVNIYSRLEKTTKRLEKTEIISEFLKKANKEELIKITNLLQGKFYADWEELKSGVSERLVLKSINQATGISQDKIEDLWKKKGDLGKVAEELIKNKQQTTLTRKKLTLEKVYENLRKLSEFEGGGTVNKKVSLVSELLSNSNSEEARHIVNTVIGDLRVGVAAGIIRDSIAKAFNKDVKEVEDNYNIRMDYGKIAELCKEGKLELNLTPGKPIKLMLAIKAENIEEAFDAVGKPAQCEYKLDGFRLQCHFDGKEIKLFTRSMENVTKQFPDVVKYLKENVKGKSYILDSEAAGISKEGKYMPFQNISQRIKRKYDIEKMAGNFPVELNIFDVIYYNGKNLMNETLENRRELLEKIVDEKKGKIVLTKKIISDNEKKVKKFYDEALKSGTEGLMIKNLQSNFRPGRYVNGWVKLKPVSEPLDLVITKCLFGEGKRAGWLSSFTLACKYEDKLLEVGKMSTGIKEKGEETTYKKMTDLIKPSIKEQIGRQAILNPEIIVEVGYEEIQKSPTYDSGFALRFPRFIKLRPDKNVSEINTLSEIKHFYENQKKH